ncbi:GGDEF domain-containing protein [Paraglaciecola hydrolytica]|nr:GGDEF domain-containing protein [Paraglaciecola hydrolytica]
MLILHKVALDRIFIIEMDGDIPILALDDKSAGGSSSAITFMDGGRRILQCELSASYQYPFCELNFQLADLSQGQPVKGGDFSKYDRVGLWLRYTAPVDAGIRLHLRNFNPDYSDLADENSLKFNSIEWFAVQGSTQPIWIPLDNMQVSTWWLSENKVSLKNSGPELTNITTLELSTGTMVVEGKYELEVEKIEFRGKFISKEQLYLILVSMWMMFAFVRLVYSSIKFNKTLRFFKFREQELTTINHLLDNKSRELQDRVGRDVLTGVLNRQGLQAIIFNQDGSINRTKGLSIAFIDIDYFKQVNDNFGHKVGDDILIEFARLIEDNTRHSTEILARWGGEEFILACPNSNLHEVELLAEKIRAIIASHRWPQGIKLTCSMGVAQMSEETFEDFIQRADLALYQAKKRGRNRIVSAVKN